MRTGLEQEATGPSPYEDHEIKLSIAVSLKRIADALEALTIKDNNINEGIHRIKRR